MSKGIVVGCDQDHEWMLPWWWSHYTQHNRYPVAFIDLGMSASAKEWCQAHGLYLSLQAPRNFIYPKVLISPELAEGWEKKYGKQVWQSREKHFYKPFALQQTPFDETIWIDLDCEIAGTLAPLFSKIHSHSKIALARDSNTEDYTTRVVAYHHHSPLLARWTDLCLRQNDRFLNDQEALSFLIHAEEIEVTELPSKYNWTIQKGIHLEAIILHWAGQWGKEVIRRVVNS